MSSQFAYARKRYAICKKCPSLTRLRRCAVCKCFMPAKVAVPTATCPLNKWGE